MKMFMKTEMQIFQISFDKVSFLDSLSTVDTNKIRVYKI